MPPELATAPAPNPATNTQPFDASAAPPPDSFDYLDTPDASMPSDPMMFDDEVEAEEGEPEEGETAAPSAPEAASETPTTTEQPTTEPALPEEIRSKVEMFDNFDRALQEEKVGLVTAIVEKMSPSEKAEFFKQFGGQAGSYPEFNVEEYEPQGDMEAAIKARWKDLDTIPHIAAETSRLDSALQEQYNTFVPHVSAANVTAQLALAKIEAICQSLGIELPDPDEAVIIKNLEGEGATYRDAVRKAADYSKQVEEGKQKRAKRPVTPGNSSKQEEKIAEGTSMVDIARRMGTIPR